jgi:hypothetical protein
VFLGKSQALELVLPAEMRDSSSWDNALFMSPFVFIAFTSSLLIMKTPITIVMKRCIKRCMQAVSDAFVCFLGEPGYRGWSFEGFLFIVFTKEQRTKCVNDPLDN